MYSVFISKEIGPKKLNIIKEIIQKYDAIITDDINEANLIVENNLSMLNMSPTQPKTITADCLILMNDDLINFNYLSNIFLRNKTFDFINCSDDTINQCTILIKTMDDKISKENPDYYLTDTFIKEKIPNCVHVNWLYQLQHSSTYIFPHNYLSCTKNFNSPKTKQKIITKSIQDKQEHHFDYTNSFIKMAFEMQKKYKYSFDRLKRELEMLNPLNKKLKEEKLDVFIDACQIGFAKLRSMPNTDESIDIYSQYQDQCKPDLNDKKYPSEQIRSSILCGPFKHTGRWSYSETRHLIYILNESFYTGSIFNKKNKIDWPYVASHIPGRNPKCCQDKYCQLVKEHAIDDFEKNKKDEIIDKRTFNKILRKSFTKEQENLILQEIYRRIKEEQLVTTKDISEIALSLFYSPLFLSVKAIISSCLSRQEWPFDKEGNLNIPNLDDEINKILPIAEEDHNELMLKYNIKPFKGSHSWVLKFMKRNNLVFRETHVERRGSINDDDVDVFLSKLADALITYGKGRILNVDETFINTFNNHIKQIALKGQSSVRVSKDTFSAKEGTTYLATIALDPEVRFPLYIIAKGRSTVCEQKYKLEDGDDKVNHSLNGWSTADVIIDYLKWISELLNGEPFALLIDTYRAHMQKKVLAAAKKLGIELIFIPPCGTGQFQPLDRYVFGFVKKKLRSYTIEINESNKKERFRIVHQNISEIWNDMSSKVIEKAWDIPGLNKYVYPDPDDTQDPDYTK